MKYIKLYEAFESQVITNTLKFLTKKIGQDTANYFSNDIKRLMNQYNIPISRIKEDDLQYLRTSKAIKVKSNEPVNNNYDIYCIKYWFSLEKGFLGKTATGNLTTPYVRLENDYSDKNKKFSEDQFNYIKDDLGITKGKLSSVLNYRDLKTGDDVLAIFGGYSNSTKVSVGKVFIDTQNYNTIFVYNNDRNDGVNVYGDQPTFAQDYQYTWRLGRDNENNGDIITDGDHFRLHLYIKDNRQLRYENKTIKSKHKANLADFNKPLNNSGYIIDWTIHNQNIIENAIEKSDFAIIVYMDKLLSLPSRNVIQSSRRDARKGAVALMSDYDIKQININNYTTKLVAKYGLHKDAEDFSKLNKVVNSIMCNKFIMFNLYLDKTMGSLNNLINQLYNLVNEDESDKEYYFNNVLSVFKNSRDRSTDINQLYKSNLNIIFTSGDENLITIIKRLLNLGEKINKYIESVDIENIHDIIMIKYKLKTIESFILDGKHKLSTPYNDVLNSFDESNKSMNRYVGYCDGATDEFVYSMERLDIIEKFVNSLLK